MISVEYTEGKNKAGDIVDAVKYQGEVWIPPFIGRGVLPQFARYLISGGVAPETLLQATRGTTVVWETGITVGTWASISIRESDIPLRIKKYEPFNKDAYK